ncbi:MAG: apolipoprotein N-acyltransferase [Gammaproteobacteria bacterium]|jgi:apolipoprotein N-acyltransferase
MRSGAISFAWPRVQANAASLLAGVSLPLAFAPFGISPFAVLAPAVLFALWETASPRKAFLHGWLFGLGMFGLGVSWVHESFQYSHVGASLATALTALLVIFLALFPALLGYLVARTTTSSQSARLLLLLPAGWVLAEWVRGWFLSGFTWLQLGYSQVDSPLRSLATVFGVYGVSWCLALLAGGLVLAVRTGSRAVLIYVGAVVVLLAGAYALEQVQWTHARDKTVHLALVQGNVPQDQKWLSSQRQPTLDRYFGLTREHWDADLVVWPESALPGFVHDFIPTLSRLAGEAEKHHTDILLGVDMLDRASQQYFNSVLAITPQLSFYHKRHLVPFAEYLPLEHLLRPAVDLLGLPVSSFSLGPSRQPPITVAGETVGLSVCYEFAFGEELIEALPKATLLINVSNDAWFGDSIGPHQNLEMARMRAVETGRYLARATNTGITAIIGPTGVIQERIPQFETRVLSAEISPMQGATPYIRMGNIPVLIGLAAVLMAVGIGAWRGTRKPR